MMKKPTRKTSTAALLRMTLASLMKHTGEQGGDLAAAFDVAPSTVSRKLNGKAKLDLDDADSFAEHFGMPVLDLLAGPTHAAKCLPVDRIATTLSGTQTLITLAPDSSATSTTRPTSQEAPQEPAPDLASPVAPQVTEPDYTPTGQLLVTTEPAPCVLCGHDTTATAGGRPQHAGGICLPDDATTPAPPEAPAAPLGTAPRTTTRKAAGIDALVGRIRARALEALVEHDGDIHAAVKGLQKHGVRDVMALFEATRAGGRYEHSKFPPTEEILKKKRQKGSDEIWEGRPKYRNAEIARSVRSGTFSVQQVDVLDMNAAYLAAFKTFLPIGRLAHSDTGVHDPRRSGVHLIDRVEWPHGHLPDPYGDRKEAGALWVSDPTLRLVLEAARHDLCAAPKIHESWTSGATENLLEKMRRVLVNARMDAIREEDTVTKEYVKDMYSKFVSTVGESSANSEIRRPDWTHTIRAQAFANLWRRAHKAHRAGLTIVQMSKTDELAVIGDWRSIWDEGQEISQVKIKDQYTIGE